MPYMLKISRRDITGYREECPFKDEEGHNANGTGPDCVPDCLWMDGDVRELHDYGTHVAEFGENVDAYDWEEYEGDAVAWAAHYLSKNHPDVTTSGTVGETASEREWLSGNTPDPYEEKEEETHVYVLGDFTDRERAEVFKLAAMPYDRMVKALRERGIGA
ncbi:hypothetical protein [Streptomyces sp. 5-10]|uniref:hypothetical protein n=1 Tax=Streptomyces sp. 5-10 TaxID=878925 RepID=UPI00168B9564|nr:hypothetical protein [Streptomyces sp. 5-10]MBD3004569.1 hypothetical protein [Streptomyces sp. 5-10]